MTKTFMVPVNADSEKDLLLYGVLDVKKVSKNLKIFSNEDRIFCYLRNSKQLFGPIYVYNDKVTRLFGDKNNLHIECYIKEKVFLMPHREVDSLTEITEIESLELLFPYRQMYENTEYPPSITGDYELDGFLTSITKKKKKYELCLIPSSKLFVYIEEKMKKCGITEYYIKNDTLFIEDKKIIETFTKLDFTEYLENDLFYNAFIFTLCCRSETKVSAPQVEHIKYTFDILVDDFGEILDNTMIPIVRKNTRYSISRLARYVHPFELIDDVSITSIIEPEQIKEIHKSEVSQSLRFELSLLLLKNLFLVNGYMINAIDKIDDFNSCFNLDYFGNTLNILATFDKDTIPTDTIDHLNGEDLILILFAPKKPAAITVKNYCDIIKRDRVSSLLFAVSPIDQKTCGLELNWTAGEFSNDIDIIWKS